jgi:hypothetical protein
MNLRAGIAPKGAACYAKAMTTILRRLKSAAMKAGGQNAELEGRGGRYALRRGLGTWEVTFEGRRDSFSDEQGAEYVVWLLLHPPPEPIHAVALALAARHAPGYTPRAADVIQQRNLGRDDAEAVRSLRRQAGKFEAVLADARASELVKAEARRKREEILEFLSKNPWRSSDGTQKCVRAVTIAIKRLCTRLARAEDAAGEPHPVLQDFAGHLREHLLIPSGRGGGHGGARAVTMFGGCFTYEPPPGVVWRRIEG